MARFSELTTDSTMLFRHDILQGIAEGRVTLAFRRWRRAPPAKGSSLRSPVGVFCLDRVTVVDEGDITPGQERSERYQSALSLADRRSLAEIRRDTKKDLPDYIQNVTR